MKTLTTEEIQAVLIQEPEWRFAEGKMIREWIFRGFPEALQFVNKLAVLSETLNHHPDLQIRFNRVRVELWSHDSGGVTNRDVAMISRIAEELCAPEN